MGDEVGVAVRALMDVLEPVEVTVGVAAQQRVLTGERRVADDCIEARVVALEDLGELDAPVERGDRRIRPRGPAR